MLGYTFANQKDLTELRNLGRNTGYTRAVADIIHFVVDAIPPSDARNELVQKILKASKAYTEKNQ